MDDSWNTDEGLAAEADVAGRSGVCLQATGVARWLPAVLRLLGVGELGGAIEAIVCGSEIR